MQLAGHTHILDVFYVLRYGAKHRVPVVVLIADILKLREFSIFGGKI